MDAIEYRQLLPDERLITAAELLSSLPARKPDPTIRQPYVVVNFVSSADGRTAVDGRSRALSSPADRELHRALRERVDAVLAGTGTVAADNYGRMLPATEQRQRRLEAARAAEPLMVMVSRSGRLPLEVPLFSEPEARVVVFSPVPPPSGLAAEVQHELLQAEAEAPLSRALETLYERYGVQTLLCEGGPAIFSALVAEGLLDELRLTVAPTLVGAEGPGVASGPPPDVPAMMELVSVLESDGSLFLRYVLSRGR